MTKETVKNLDNTRYNKDNVYREFVYWFAMPNAERIKLGIETQADFSQVNKVHVNTLSVWKKRPDFMKRVDEIHHEWGQEMTGGVIQGMYKAAVKGNPMSQLLWLQYFKNFNPKRDEYAQNNGKLEVTTNDIRFLIEGLPLELKQKHYGYLRELLDDAARVANAIDSGEIPDGIRNIEESARAERLEEAVQGETDNAPRDVPVERTNAIPRRHSESVCDDMERQVSAHNYQSAAWRG